jgi:hypothetical protein
MTGPQPTVPDALPVLSRGRHRNPRKGACFMEMASVLAGEKWSDHPRCTHPLLGELARHVNDRTTDEHRSQLSVLIPSVVGLTSEDLRVDARIALRCATAALPVAAEDRQNVLAVSILVADRVLADLEGRSPDALAPERAAALAAAPRAAGWASELVRRAGISAKGFRKHAAPNTVRGSVQAIADACVADPDGLLRRLLTDVVAECADLCAETSPAAAPAEARVAAG